MRHMDTCLFKQKASRRKGVAFGSYTSKVFGAGQQTSVRLSQSKLHFFHSTSAVTLMNKQLGTWKTPFGLRLRLIQNANSRLMYSHEVLQALLSPSMADAVPLTPAITHIHVDMLYCTCM